MLAMKRDEDNLLAFEEMPPNAEHFEEPELMEDDDVNAECGP